MYQVLARKWRPQTFEALVGQRHVATTLANAVQAGQLAHAYIFAGVRGTGKTTVARLLAKCVNCEKGPTPTPCNACTACTEITDGRAMDVMELDAASRTGVDNIRELQEVVAYAPVRDRYKVLIIDEAHMLSKAAFNALLKTLEEPPPQVIFVLATTEIHKVLPTILSRCQVFEFRRLPAREIAAHLRSICDDEKIEVSDATLDRIARAGEGSVRDSLSVLERVLAFCGRSIGDEAALQALGAVRAEILTDMVRAIAGRDAASMLSTLDGLADEGHDLVLFWSEMIGVLRDLLLARLVPGRDDLPARSPEEMRALVEAARALSDDDLTRTFQILADLEPGLKMSSQPRFLFEATLIRLANLGAVRPIEELLARLGPETTPAISPARAAPPQKKNEVRDRRETEPEPPVTAPGDFLEAWHRAVDEAKPMLGAALERAVGIRFEAGTLEIRCADGSDPLRRVIERPECREVLRGCAEKIAGGSVRLSVLPAEIDEPAPASPRGDDRPARSPRPPATASDRRLADLAREKPAVRKLLDEFGAQVVDIRPAEPSGPRGPSKESP